MAKRAPSKDSQPAPDAGAGMFAPPAPARAPRAARAVAPPPEESDPSLTYQVPRPTPLGALLGQTQAVARLLEVFASGRAHHAWIFQGPVGVGKCTAAVAFAAMLLDGTTQRSFTGEVAPDPDSHVQALLAAGTHPDLVYIHRQLAAFHPDAKVRERKQTNIPIDVVRHFVLESGMLAPSVRSPGQLAGKVFIVDEAELLSIEAQNAMLKFLEEPPPGTVLILVTNYPERLLATVRSRCQRVPFVPLDERAMQAWVNRATRDQSLSLGPQDQWLLGVCAGSPGHVLEAQRTGLGAWWGQLGARLDFAISGKHSPELGTLLAKLTDDWAKEYVAQRPAASKESANRQAADWMLRVLAWRTRAGLLQRPGAMLARIDAITDADAELGRNVSATMVFEKLAAKLAAAG